MTNMKWCPFCGTKLRLERESQRLIGFRVCSRCDRKFDDGQQVENFAWEEVSPGVFEDRHGAPFRVD
jgi:ribosomal protein L37AE/L43A